MECMLEANPVPDIIWYQGSKVILDTGRVRMVKKATGKDTYLLRLEISNPTKQDGGNYRCNACNSFGESNANIALNFQGMRATITSPCHLYCFRCAAQVKVDFQDLFECNNTSRITGVLTNGFLFFLRWRRWSWICTFIYRKAKNHSK